MYWKTSESTCGTLALLIVSLLGGKGLECFEENLESVVSTRVDVASQYVVRQGGRHD